MKRDVLKKRAVERKKSSFKRDASGYVPCLPEYEQDLSKQVDFDKPLSEAQFKKELRKSKKASR